MNNSREYILCEYHKSIRFNIKRLDDYYKKIWQQNIQFFEINCNFWSRS